MPFKIGIDPVKRTLEYLQAGKIVFRENVKIFTVHFNKSAENHKGVRDFVYWHLDQIQYKNPTVQCLTIRDLMPSPYIRIYFEDAKDIIINVNCRDKMDILNHLENFTAICKAENELSIPKDYPKEYDALFGYSCKRHCMCEIMGQVPCPRIVNLPDIWRNSRKYRSKKFNVPFYYTERGLVEIEED